MTTDSEITEQYLTFVRSGFLIYVLVFLCHVTSNLERRDIDSCLLTERGFRFWQLFDIYMKYVGGDYELT